MRHFNMHNLYCLNYRALYCFVTHSEQLHGQIWVATHRVLNADLCYDKHHWRAAENLIIGLRFVENEGYSLVM